MNEACVLHVGMPKCGSSALQTALSAQPEVAGAAAPAARYVVLRRDGTLARAEEVVQGAALAPSGYLISARAADLEAMTSAQRRHLREVLSSAGSDGARLILSNEGWGQEFAEFAQGRFLERLGLQCAVVLYVRPQPLWCNAAWWQWGAWTRAPLARWVGNQLERICWSRVVSGWRAVPGVGSVHVRLLPPNIVDDFCGWLGLESPGEVVANPSLPGTVLRLFQRHRELRRGPHDSAIEFALGRHLALPSSRTPWVLPPALVERIIGSCRDSNLELLEQLEPAQREQMRADPAWWSAEHYADRPVLPWQPRPPIAQDVDELAAAALDAVHRLDTRCRELEQQLREAREAQQGARAERATAWPFRSRKD